MLADPGGEDEGVEAVERRRHRADGGGDAIREDAQRERGGRRARALELLDARRLAGEAVEPRLRLERLLDRLEPEAAAAQQVQDDLDVDRPGPRRHRHALEGAEPHRRVDRAAVAHRGHRAAAAEVADDETRYAHLLGRPLHREAVEAEAPDSPLVAPAGRQRIGRRLVRDRAMECGVEHRDVRRPRERPPRVGDRCERRPVVQGRELGELRRARRGLRRRARPAR